MAKKFDMDVIDKAFEPPEAATKGVLWWTPLDDCFWTFQLIAHGTELFLIIHSEYFFNIFSWGIRSPSFQNQSSQGPLSFAVNSEAATEDVL